MSLHFKLELRSFWWKSVFNERLIKRFPCEQDMVQPKLETKLKDIYNDFFKNLEINIDTGLLHRLGDIFRGKKFPTYPFIGSNYGKSKRILFVGLDIGSDEKPGVLQSFEERRARIEEKPIKDHNPHIAGTYITALYFLKDSLGWQTYWHGIKGFPTCQQALRKGKAFPSHNPLSYVALTNFHKFVSVNRKTKAGSKDRKFLDKKVEMDLFFKEIEIFDPDLLIFQSTRFGKKNQLQTKLLKLNQTGYGGPHPAYRGERKPDVFVKKINRFQLK